MKGRKNMKKILAMLLVVLMLATILVSCKKDPEGPVGDVTTPVSVDPNRVPPEVKNFDGYEFKMKLDSWDGCEYKLMAPEALNGEGINDTMFQRNKMIESLYNIKITQDLSTEHNPNASFSFLQNMGSSGEHFADIYSHDALQMIGTYAPNDHFLNVYDMQSLRLDKEWWDQDFLSETTINGRAYTFTGDLQINDDVHQISTMMNLSLYEETYPEKSFYEIVVKNGAWTMEEFYNTWYGFGSYDGGTTGTVDDDDKIGYGYDERTVSYLYMGAGIKVFRMENGQPVLNLTSEKSLKMKDQLQRIIDGNSGLKSRILGKADFNYDSSRTHFAAGKMLFTSHNFTDALGWFLDMEDTLVYPPLPKYDLEQDRYYSLVHMCFEPMAIPKNVPDKEKTALITEALCFYSDKLEAEVMDILIQERLTSELEPREILQLTLRSKGYDMDYMSNITGFTDKANNLLITKTLGNYATEMDSLEDKAINARGKGKLQLFLTKYAKLNFQK